MPIKLTITIQPTFRDINLDVYHKAGATIEFDPEEISSDEARRLLLNEYTELIMIERAAVEAVRERKINTAKGLCSDIKRIMHKARKHKQKQDDLNGQSD